MPARVPSLHAGCIYRRMRTSHIERSAVAPALPHVAGQVRLPQSNDPGRAIARKADLASVAAGATAQREPTPRFAVTAEPYRQRGGRRRARVRTLR